MPETILYCGAVAQSAGRGGLLWFHLQFLVGLRRLGHDVVLIDRLEPGMCRDERGRPASFAGCVERRAFLDVVQRAGLGESYSLVHDHGAAVVGLPPEQVRERARGALLLDVMGYCDDPSILESAARRVFLDIDPGFPQMWRELGLHDAFAGHDRFATLALSIGRPGCGVPTCGLDWITLPQPIVLDRWPSTPLPVDGPFTSIGAWRGPNGPVDFGGRRYGLRCHEFRRFLGIPGRFPGERFAQAMAIDPGDARDVAALGEAGWTLLDPVAEAGDPDRFQAFVRGSRAEFVVPKEMYVAAATGLLSDRSGCYLASGRPVLTRDTGLADHYPVGRGLIAFSTPDEAVAGVEAVLSDPRGHARAAREVAAAFLDSEVVLPRFLEAVSS